MSIDGTLTPSHALAGADSRSRGGSRDGALIVAWQNPDSRLIGPVGLLEHTTEQTYRFRYLARALEVPGFGPFVSFPDWSRDYRSERLFPLFSQRIMSPRRPDYPEFLRQLHLTDAASPWEQLARSEGRRTGDTVQVFPIPAVEDDGTSTCRFLVHGIRHVNGGRLPELAAGDALRLQDHPDNPVNAAAVRVLAPGGEVLGYVPDLLLGHLETMRLAGSVHVVLEHVNGPEAPMHLRLLARMEGRVPTGYRPMRGPGWETVSRPSARAPWTA